MTKKTMDFVMRTKELIYIAMIVLLILGALGIAKTCHADEALVKEQEGFWPPDMVPHTHIPEDDDPTTIWPEDLV